MQHAREDYQRIQDPATERPSMLPEGRNPIGEDEPVMLFRAQDKHFIGVLQDNHSILATVWQQEERLDEMMEEVTDFVDSVSLAYAKWYGNCPASSIAFDNPNLPQIAYRAGAKFGMEWQAKQVQTTEKRTGDEGPIIMKFLSPPGRYCPVTSIECPTCDGTERIER